MNIKNLFEQLITAQSLTTNQMREVMNACMKGELSQGQIMTFLALMRMKGETAEELSEAAKVLMDYAHPIDLGSDLIDIVGTGGDNKNTFNISTTCSFVASAAGAKVAKHGNRSVSGKSGSADLLMKAGFELQLGDEQLQACMSQHQLCFLFAPHFHQAMQQVRQARQQLGIRTFFNILGPLVNPARVKKQVVGVCDSRLLPLVAEILANMGSERALILHAQDGMDEISINAPTDVLEWHQGHLTSWSIEPKDYGLYHASLDEILVSSPDESLKILECVLEGKKSAARDIVLLNTAAALYCAGLAMDLQQGIAKASKAIDSGQARLRFEQLKDFTQPKKTTG